MVFFSKFCVAAEVFVGFTQAASVILFVLMSRLSLSGTTAYWPVPLRLSRRKPNLTRHPRWTAGDIAIIAEVRVDDDRPAVLFHRPAGHKARNRLAAQPRRRLRHRPGEVHRGAAALDHR